MGPGHVATFGHSPFDLGIARHRQCPIL